MRERPRSRRRIPVAAVVAVVAVVAAAAAATALAAERPVTRPGWEEHVRPALAGGEGGVAWFAVAGPEADAAVLDPAGYTVHAVRPDDAADERVHPAGVPVRLPGGAWRVWIESGTRMSPASARPEGSAEGARLLAVVPAGAVALPPEPAVPADAELWLLHAEPPPGAATGGELSRRSPLARAADGVTMPEGRTLAGAWRQRDRRWVAFSRPFTVAAGATVAAPLERPDVGHAWLVVAAGGGAFADPAPPLELTRPGEEAARRPDLQLTTRDGVHAVWYDLAPGTVVLRGGAGDVYLPPQPLELRGGEIAGVRGAFTRRPRLDVALALPELLRRRPFDLVVRTLPEHEELARVTRPPEAQGHRFESGLVQAPLEVVLETSVGRFSRRVDLTGVTEGEVVLDPEVIEIYGTVRHGGEPHAARIELASVSGEKILAEADETGAYLAQTLQPVRSVHVWLDGVEREPWIDLFFRPLDRTQQLDFDLADADVTVRVVDAETGAPVAGADVGVRNEYLPPDDDDEEAPLDEAEWQRRSRALGQSVFADESGVAHLPSPRPGRLEIHASAEGYRDLEPPLTVEIPDPPQDREIEVLLEPYGARREIHLLLPGGGTAAGAEVLRRTGDGTAATFRADGHGVVRVPLEPAGGLLVVRHPAAGIALTDAARWPAEEPVEWVLPPAAELPLSLRVTDASGERAVPAGLVLWVGEHRLDEELFVWLFRRPPFTDGRGLVALDGMPAAPFRVLAYAPHAAAQGRSGALDPLATDVAYPWPATVELRAEQ